MTDTKRLIVGIVLVAVGLGLVLSANSIWALGIVLGLIGSWFVVRVLIRGKV